MSTTAFYLSQVLPIVLAIAAICWIAGLAMSWLLWGDYPERAVTVEIQNENLQREIRRLAKQD